MAIVITKKLLTFSNSYRIDCNESERGFRFMPIVKNIILRFIKILNFKCYAKKKEKTWNLIKRWLKIPMPGFCPNNIFPTFRLLLKASLDLLKTSLAAITLLFFRSNQRWLLKPILYNTLS